MCWRREVARRWWGRGSTCSPSFLSGAKGERARRSGAERSGGGGHSPHTNPLKLRSTSDKSEKMFDLMSLIMSEARLDSQSRIVEMLKEKKAELQSR